MNPIFELWAGLAGPLPLPAWATVLLAAALGALIGAERERRYRIAGLRTNALVSVVSAIFVHTAQGWQAADGAVHNQAYVISGAAWVAGALLLKDGAAVKGLDSAITIWGAAAVGCAVGGGSVQSAIAYTLGLLLCNTFLRSAALRFGGADPYCVAGKPQEAQPVPPPSKDGGLVNQQQSVSAAFMRDVLQLFAQLAVQQPALAKQLLSMFEKASTPERGREDKADTLAPSTPVEGEKREDAA